MDTLDLHPAIKLDLLSSGTGTSFIYSHPNLD
jgi:hypothetical protein